MSTNPASPGHRPSVLRGLTVYALTTTTFFAASSVPTPLYHLYQNAWGFSPGILTVIFGVYALSLLSALLTTGSLSDYLGRRRVIVGALVLEALSMLIFVRAGGVADLIAARVLQGVATGIAASALGAATLDLDRTHGPLLNSISPMLGMAIGVLGTSFLVQYGPAPLHLVYILLIVVFVLQGVAVIKTPETAPLRSGVLRSMLPRVQVPAAARGALFKVLPANIAVWALGGFYLSLGPTLAKVVTRSDSIMTGGWVVSSLTIAAVIVVLVLRNMPAQRMLSWGTLLLSLGLVVTLIGILCESPMLFFAGTIISGSGFGISFQGSMRSVMLLAQAHERAGLMAALYILCYLAFSVPTIIAGTLVHVLGLRITAEGYAVILIVLSVSTAIGGMRGVRAAA
jgi:MFS family permease